MKETSYYRNAKPEMKMKTARTRAAAVCLSMLACRVLLSGVSTHGCTVFCYGQGDSVLAGRSFDVPDDPGFGMLIVPATAGRHGWFCCSRFGYPWADGMNDHGLFFAVADVPDPASHKTTSSRPPGDLKAFASGMLANCASVDEVVHWCRKQPIPSLYGSVHQGALGYYRFDTPGHMLVADRSGDSVVLEWYCGKLWMTRKHGRYQLMTNFLLSDPKEGSFPCPRYVTDSKIFDNASGPALQTCVQVLENTAQGITRYSLLCDLRHGDVYVYLRRGFDRPKMLHLADELKKGPHELDLDKWFGRQKPEPLSPPPVIAPATISAAEILQRGLDALGGENAAAKMRSYDCKGTLDNHDMECLRALPVDSVALRPDLFRTVVDFTEPGYNGGQFAEGFDGHMGWNIGLDGRCSILRAEEYELRKDDAVFGFHDEPTNYETAECPGEARFDGELCYDLKLVTRTHHEQFHYYDATNFLLVGTFTREPANGQVGWMKTSFRDYRRFGGFLIPTLIDSRVDSGGSTFHLNSMEINTVTNLPAVPQPVQLLTHLDGQIYDRYVGQYRKSLLLGLLHLGPTLSVSRATDEVGDHLVASVRGLPAFQQGSSADLVPVSDDSFVVNPGLTGDKIQLTFVRPRNGKTARVLVNWNGKRLSGARISDKPAG